MEPMHPYRCKILSTSLRTMWKKPVGDNHRRTFCEVEGPTPDCQGAFHNSEGTLFSFHLYFHIFFSIHVCAMEKKFRFSLCMKGLSLDSFAIFRGLHSTYQPGEGPLKWQKGLKIHPCPIYYQAQCVPRLGGRGPNELVP
jgi:hypothetical protein